VGGTSTKGGGAEPGSDAETGKGAPRHGVKL